MHCQTHFFVQTRRYPKCPKHANDGHRETLFREWLPAASSSTPAKRIMPASIRIRPLSFPRLKIPFGVEDVWVWEVARVPMYGPQIANDGQITGKVITLEDCVSDWGMGQATKNGDAPPAQRLFEQGLTVWKRVERAPVGYFSGSNCSIDLLMRLRLRFWEDTQRENARQHRTRARVYSAPYQVGGHIGYVGFC